MGSLVLGNLTVRSEFSSVRKVRGMDTSTYQTQGLGQRLFILIKSRLSDGRGSAGEVSAQTFTAAGLEACCSQA